LIQKFSLDGINESSGVFDPTKLEWMNGLYIRKLPVAEFIERAQPFLDKEGLDIPADQFAALASHVQERVKTLVEVPGMVDFLADSPLARQIEAMFQKGVDAAKAREILTLSLERLGQLAEFSTEAIDQTLRGVASELGLKPGAAFVALRIAVTGKTITPPLFESFAVLGRDKVLSRIRETVELLPQ
jgi:glutamyl-tRNA synthetase